MCQLDLLVLENILSLFGPIGNLGNCYLSHVLYVFTLISSQILNISIMNMFSMIGYLLELNNWA